MPTLRSGGEIQDFFISLTRNSIYWDDALRQWQNRTGKIEKSSYQKSFLQAAIGSEAGYSDAWESNKTLFKGVENKRRTMNSILISWPPSCQKQTGCSVLRTTKRPQSCILWPSCSHAFIEKVVYMYIIDHERNQERSRISCLFINCIL